VWTPKTGQSQDVASWLQSKGFDQGICHKFTANDVDAEVLLTLNVENLKSDIGIESYGVRVEIKNAINDLFPGGVPEIENDNTINLRGVLLLRTHTIQFQSDRRTLCPNQRARRGIHCEGYRDPDHNQQGPQEPQEMFFNQRDDWIQPVKGFNVEASFLWIVEGKRGREQVEEKVTELRGRNLPNWPKYAEHWASVEQIDRQLAETLAYIHPNHWKADAVLVMTMATSK